MPPTFTVLPQVKENVSPDARMAPVPRGQFSNQLANQNLEVANEIFKKAKQEADSTKFYEAATKVSALRDTLLYQQGTGALHQKGENALAVRSRVTEDFRKGVGEIEQSLKNDEQIGAFRRFVFAQHNELDGILAKHEGREIQNYKNQTMEAAATRFGNAAVATALDDPDATQVNLQRHESALRELAKTGGLSPENTELMVASARSKTQFRIVNMMLASKQDLAASKYFETHKDQLVGDDLVHAKAAVEEGSTIGEATRITDRIFASKVERTDTGGNNWTLKETPGAQTIGDLLKESAKIENPRVRKLVESFGRQRLADREAEINAQSEGVFMDIAKKMEQRPGEEPRVIATPDEWENRLIPQHREALKRMAARPENDDAAYIEWATLQATPEKIAALSPGDFYTKYYSRFGTAQRSTALEEWKKARASGGKGDKGLEIKSAFNDKELALNAMKSVGYANIVEADGLDEVGKDAKKAKAFREFVDQAEDQYKLWAIRNKKAPDDIEKKRIMSDMLFRQTQVYVSQDPMSFGSILGEIVPGVGYFTQRPYRKAFGELDEKERQAFYVPMDSIPSARVDEIKNLLLNNRRVVTDWKVQQIRKAQMLGDDAAILKILAETP
jgi:hypothetical protein